MLHRDYLVEQFMRFADAIRRSLEKSQGEPDNKLAAADMLEAAIGSATNIDGATLLLLSPDSIASILMVTDTDPDVVEYLARTLLLESSYLDQAGEQSRAQLRRDQAFAIANGYGIPLSDDKITPEELEEFFERTEHRGL
jgi:hypothetical protein